MSTTNMQEAFANGQCAMIISGSYGRGNIILANPDLNFGAFVLPGLTEDTTNCLTGVNAAQCISASASDEEKEAALTFLSYLARTEVAQKWSDETGEPPSSREPPMRTRTSSPSSTSSTAARCMTGWPPRWTTMLSMRCTTRFSPSCWTSQCRRVPGEHGHHH